MATFTRGNSCQKNMFSNFECAIKTILDKYFGLFVQK